MVLKFENIKENPTTVLRRAGYIFQRKEGAPASTRGDNHSSTRGGEMSFVLPMARSGYPRFHIYCHLEDTNLIVNLHLDQKKNTYGDETRHHGEYDNSGPVEQEANRLKSVIK